MKFEIIACKSLINFADKLTSFGISLWVVKVQGKRRVEEEERWATRKILGLWMAVPWGGWESPVSGGGGGIACIRCEKVTLPPSEKVKICPAICWAWKTDTESWLPS